MTTFLFSEHPDGRHRTHMRNTILGWVEERDPEGFIMVQLEDGFFWIMEGDEWQVTGEPDYLLARAQDARERYREVADA